MCPNRSNKYRQALEILMRGRDVLIDNLAEEVLNQGEALAEGGFLFNDFIESQGPRLHFLCILTSQLELAAEKLDEPQNAAPAGKSSRRSSRRRRRNRKNAEQVNATAIDQPGIERNASKDGPSDDL